MKNICPRQACKAETGEYPQQTHCKLCGHTLAPWWIIDRLHNYYNLYADKEWRTPVEDLPLQAWAWQNEHSGKISLCHGPAEAAYRCSLGYKVMLLDEYPASIYGIWSGWVITGAIDPVALSTLLSQKGEI